MPRKRKENKISSQTLAAKPKPAKASQTKAKAKNKTTAKHDKPMSNSRDLESDVLTQMKKEGYDGKQFVNHLKAGVLDRLNKRGKPPRMVRYFFYCAWAHALIRNNVGPIDSEYSFPSVVLKFIRDIAPGDIKGEIREDAYSVHMVEFCEALKIPKLNNRNTED